MNDLGNANGFNNGLNIGNQFNFDDMMANIDPEDLKNLKDNQKLTFHRQQYFESLRRHRQSLADTNEMYRIIDYFKNNKVIVVKLNHCMSDSGQN